MNLIGDVARPTCGYSREQGDNPERHYLEPIPHRGVPFFE
jgi:hypothetical protein